jgi:sulfur-oxidizing protein SoxA
MRRIARGVAALLACVTLTLAGSAAGDATRASEEIQKYRQMLQEGNPAELSEMRGAELWVTPRGPKHATLERCDLGLGPGRLDGADTRLPRYFSDTGQVQDLESRLVTCMMRLQGFTRKEAIEKWYEQDSDIGALVTFIAAKSKGMPINVNYARPQERRLYAIGKELFFRRAGPLDFACATCHSQDGRRIRLQELPNFLDRESARGSLVTWPAYRVSESTVWTMERRLVDCIRQMRWPEPDYLSEAIVALEVYLRNQANGGVMEAPGIKR